MPKTQMAFAAARMKIVLISWAKLAMTCVLSMEVYKLFTIIAAAMNIPIAAHVLMPKTQMTFAAARMKIVLISWSTLAMTCVLSMEVYKLFTIIAAAMERYKFAKSLVVTNVQLSHLIKVLTHLDKFVGIVIAVRSGEDSVVALTVPVLKFRKTIVTSRMREDDELLKNKNYLRKIFITHSEKFDRP